jgi:putative hydrolase of HD superfamily
MNKTDIVSIYNFTKVLGAFKELERFKGQVFWRDYPFPQRYESDADHSWRMTLLLVMIAPQLSQPLDIEKALKMSLIHDVPELLAGDASPIGEDGTGLQTHAYNKNVQESRYLSEKQAAEELFGQLPTHIGAELLDLWLEYEQQSTFESKVIKALDKFEGKLQVLEWTQGKMYSKHWEFTEKYGVEAAQADPALNELMDLLITELGDKYQPYGQSN